MADLVECGAAIADAAAAAVMIHGRDRDAAEMAALSERFALASIRYFCPQAPGNSWYPERFTDPLAWNQPALGRSLASIDALLGRLNGLGFADERIVLCGFSQGACLAAQMLLRRPSGYAAAVIFTGGLIGPPGTVWRVDRQLRGLPVLLTGSEVDDWVPASRTRETGAVLAGFGARVETMVYEDRPHVVSDDEIARARALLAGRIAGSGPVAGA